MKEITATLAMIVFLIWVGGCISLGILASLMGTLTQNTTEILTWPFQ